MPGRPLLADVLAERALAQERDERAAAEHREERGQHARAEHVRHSAASASCSTPAEREPLSRTKSPGRSTRGSSSAASARVGRPVPFAALGGRRVAGGQLADADHDVDAEARAGAPDLGVPARRVGPELGHVAEHRDRAGARRPARRARPARSRSRPGWRCRRRSRARRRRARSSSWPRSGESSIAAAPSARPGRRQARAHVGRGGRGQVRGVVGRRAAARSARRARRARRAARASRPLPAPRRGSARRRRARRTSSCAGRRAGRARAAARRRAPRRRRRPAAPPAARPPRARRPRDRPGTPGARARCSSRGRYRAPRWRRDRPARRPRSCPARRCRARALGSSRNSVSGRPRRLLWLRWVASVGTCGAQSAASMSFVDVLPFDPAMPITFPPQARRTWRAIAPSAVSGSSASSTQTPSSGRERPLRQSTATAPAARTSSRKSCPSARSPSSAQKSAPGPAARESLTTLSMRVAGSPLSRRVPSQRRPPRAGSPAASEQLLGHACGRRTARRRRRCPGPARGPCPG